MAKQEKKITDLLNFSELTRHVSGQGKNRNGIRPSYIPKKHWGKMDKLIYVEFPVWWENYKRTHEKTAK